MPSARSDRWCRLAVDVGGVLCAHAPKYLAHHGHKLVLLERLGDPAGSSCRLGLLFIPTSNSVVRNTIGSPLNAGSLRNSQISASPFMTGMFGR